LNADAISIKYDRDGDLLAIGCKNGAKILYSRVDCNTQIIQKNLLL
jgi:hypothetical protein